MAFDRGTGRIGAARDAARERTAPAQGRPSGYGTYSGGAKPASKPLAPIGGRWSVEELVAMVPALLAEREGAAFGSDAYAGIGSRETPDDVMAEMTGIARALEARGLVMRSGGAKGADSAFQDGTSDPAMRQVFVPSRSFNGQSEGILMRPEIEPKARELVHRYHPAPERLQPFAMQLMMRNGCQMFGEGLDDSSRLVICYTPDGAASGGTGQAIRMAEDAGIPVLNLRIPEIRDAVADELGVGRIRERAPKAFDFSDTRAERTWDRSTSAVFFRGADEYGPLMNMTPRFPYVVDGVRYGSGEHQYQAGRFPHRPDIQELVVSAKDAFAAKAVAREHDRETRPDWDAARLEVMAYVVSCRRAAIPVVRELQDQAHARGLAIVEQSSKDRQWGAVEQSGRLVGRNLLGWVHDQSAAGAVMERPPVGATWPTAAELAALREAREAREAGREVPAARVEPAAREAQGPGAVRYRPDADVSSAKADVIVNTVNANLSRAGRNGTLQDGNPVMGKGVAKAFADRYGQALLKPYADAIRRGELKAGGVQMLRMPDGQVVANLATKQDWRDPSRIEWVEAGLEALAEEMRRGGHDSVALPPPGCGNGGLDWREVEPLVLRHLADFDVTITAAPSGAAIDRSGRPIQGVEGRATVLQAARDEARHRAASADRASAEFPAAGTRPSKSMGMYFAYGRDRRPDFAAPTTFEAILSGERTSTTRFGKFADDLRSAKPGQVVRFFEEQDFWKPERKDDKGRFVDVVVRGIETIDLANCAPERLEAWSAVEGWTPGYGRRSGSKGPGVQMRYEAIPGQEILLERGRGRPEARSESASGIDDAAVVAEMARRAGRGR